MKSGDPESQSRMPQAASDRSASGPSRAGREGDHARQDRDNLVSSSKKRRWPPDAGALDLVLAEADVGATSSAPPSVRPASACLICQSTAISCDLAATPCQLAGSICRSAGASRDGREAVAGRGRLVAIGRNNLHVGSIYLPIAIDLMAVAMDSMRSQMSHDSRHGTSADQQEASASLQIVAAGTIRPVEQVEKSGQREERLEEHRFHIADRRREFDANLQQEAADSPEPGEMRVPIVDGKSRTCEGKIGCPRSDRTWMQSSRGHVRSCFELLGDPHFGFGVGCGSCSAVGIGAGCTVASPPFFSRLILLRMRWKFFAAGLSFDTAPIAMSRALDPTM